MHQLYGRRLLFTCHFPQFNWPLLPFKMVRTEITINRMITLPFIGCKGNDEQTEYFNNVSEFVDSLNVFSTS